MTLPPNYDAWRLQGPPEADEPEWVDCPDCDGTGHTLHDEHGPTLDCETCAGEGVLPAEFEEPDGDYLFERRRDAMEDRG